MGAILSRVLGRVIACLAAAASLLASAAALASGNPPNGINIGIDFNWHPGPSGYTAAFIASINPSGATLNTCVGVCNFPIAYSVGGVAQAAVTSGGTYNTWIPPAPRPSEPATSRPPTRRR
jgi:hypothetical protein